MMEDIGCKEFEDGSKTGKCQPFIVTDILSPQYWYLYQSPNPQILL